MSTDKSFLIEMYELGDKITDSKGYIRVYYKKFSIYEHRLVYRIHKGNIRKGFQVHHIDQNKLNNNIENLKVLRWDIHFTLHRELRRK